MKKVYKINDSNFGIDLDSVSSFYIDGEIDTYHGKNIRYLNILVGGEMGAPNKITLVYSHYTYEKHKDAGFTYTVEKISENVDGLYMDLINHFNK